jgi:hypothetical protein
VVWCPVVVGFGGQEGGSVVLCAWCEGRCLTAEQDSIPHAVICILTSLVMDKVLSEKCGADLEDP